MLATAKHSNGNELLNITHFLVAISCEEPYLSRHLHLARFKEVYLYGSTVHFECEDGYKLNGTTVAKCMIDKQATAIGHGGKWSAQSPVCNRT